MKYVYKYKKHFYFFTEFIEMIMFIESIFGKEENKTIKSIEEEFLLFDTVFKENAKIISKYFEDQNIEYELRPVKTVKNKILNQIYIKNYRPIFKLEKINEESK